MDNHFHPVNFKDIFMVLSMLKAYCIGPQSNVEVESFNWSILKAVKVTKVEGKSWKIEIRNFLFQYHIVTGLSPAKLLMNLEL